MKLHHAAALALVFLGGCAEPATQSRKWLSMLPPNTGDKDHPNYDESAPLSKWTPFGTYLSEEACQSAMEYDRNQLRREGTGSPALNTAFATVRCVSTDDARLKRPPK